MQLASTESILQEATSSMSLVTQFEQEVATLQRIMHDIQTSEEMLTQKMKSLNEKVLLYCIAIIIEFQFNFFLIPF